MSELGVAGLVELIRDLNAAAREARPTAADVVKRGAVNIKREWRANARASAGKHGRRYPSAVSFELNRTTAMGAVATIGPELGAQGSLGFLETGSVNNPPHNDGKRALDAELPRFEEELTKALAERLLW